LSNTTDSTPDPLRATQLAGGYQIDAFLKHEHRSDNSDDHAGRGKPATGNSATEGAWLVTGGAAGADGTETRPENIGMFPLIII
jgi:hypothetical protein